MHLASQPAKQSKRAPMNRRPDSSHEGGSWGNATLYIAVTYHLFMVEVGASCGKAALDCERE